MLIIFAFACVESSDHTTTLHDVTGCNHKILC